MLLLHDKLLTNAQRARRGMDNDDGCPLCHRGTENLDHTFRQCSTTFTVWNQFSSFAYFIIFSIAIFRPDTHQFV